MGHHCGSGGGDLVLEGFALLEAFNILQRQECRVMAAVGGGAAPVGHQNSVIQMAQGAVLLQRLLLVNIQDRPEMACLQVSSQRLLVDDVAPGGIDQDGIGL